MLRRFYFALKLYFPLKGGDFMTFTKNSGLVKVWVGLVMAGTYELEQVPTLFNLKDVVTEVVNGTAA